MSILVSKSYLWLLFAKHYVFTDVYQTLRNEVADLKVVKLLRSEVQIGIMKARMMGVQQTTGDVLTFLDSHCELRLQKNCAFV